MKKAHWGGEVPTTSNPHRPHRLPRRSMTFEDIHHGARGRGQNTLNPAKFLCMNLLSEFARHANQKVGRRKRTLSDSDVDANLVQSNDEKHDKRKKMMTIPPWSNQKHTSDCSNKTLKKAKHVWQVKSSVPSHHQPKVSTAKHKEQPLPGSHDGALKDTLEEEEEEEEDMASGEKSTHSPEGDSLPSRNDESVSSQMARPVAMATINPLDHPHLYEQSRWGGLKLLEQLGSGRENLPHLTDLSFPPGRRPAVADTPDIDSSSEASSSASPEHIANVEKTPNSREAEPIAGSSSSSTDTAGSESGLSVSLPAADPVANDGDNVPFLQQWQNQHLAKAVVDNAINKTLEELGLSPSPEIASSHVYARQRREVESAGVSAAIHSRGLRRHSMDRAHRMQPIVNRLTQVSENIFAQNVFGRSRNPSSGSAPSRPIPTLRRSASATEAMVPSLQAAGLLDPLESNFNGVSVSSTPIREPENVFDLRESEILCSVRQNCLENSSPAMSADEMLGGSSDMSDGDSDSKGDQVSLSDVVDEEAEACAMDNGGAGANETCDLLDQAINAAISERGLSINPD